MRALLLKGTPVQIVTSFVFLLLCDVYLLSSLISKRKASLERKAISVIEKYEKELGTVDQELFRCLKGKFLELAPNFKSFAGALTLLLAPPDHNNFLDDDIYCLECTVKKIKVVDSFLRMDRDLINKKAFEELRRCSMQHYYDYALPASYVPGSYEDHLKDFCKEVIEILNDAIIRPKPKYVLALSPFAKVSKEHIGEIKKEGNEIRFGEYGLKLGIVVDSAKNQEQVNADITSKLNCLSGELISYD